MSPARWRETGLSQQEISNTAKQAAVNSLHEFLFFVFIPYIIMFLQYSSPRIAELPDHLAFNKGTKLFVESLS
jgi:hypothetical protein